MRRAAVERTHHAVDWYLATWRARRRGLTRDQLVTNIARVAARSALASSDTAPEEAELAARWPVTSTLSSD